MNLWQKTTKTQAVFVAKLQKRVGRFGDNAKRIVRIWAEDTNNCADIESNVPKNYSHAEKPQPAKRSKNRKNGLDKAGIFCFTIANSMKYARHPPKKLGGNKSI